MPSSGSVDVTRTGSYILTYEKYDPAGNRGITTRTINIVDILDTTTPTATLLYTPNTLTNGNVLVILVSPSEPITLTNNSGSLSYIFSTNGSFSFTYQDASGNTGSTTAVVDWIDRITPIVSIRGTPTLSIEE
jgi:hypothetical protein